MFYIQNYTVHKCSVCPALDTQHMSPYFYEHVRSDCSHGCCYATYQQTRETHEFTLSNSTRLEIR